MDAKIQRSSHVVTVLRNNSPIAFIASNPAGSDANSVDIYISPDATDGEVQEVLAEASQAIGFLVWKTTGVLPTPRGYIGATDDADRPF